MCFIIAGGKGNKGHTCEAAKQFCQANSSLQEGPLVGHLAVDWPKVAGLTSLTKKAQLTC